MNIRGKGFQVEIMAPAKALRWECAWMFEERQWVAWLEQLEEGKRKQMKLEQGVQMGRDANHRQHGKDSGFHS